MLCKRNSRFTVHGQIAVEVAKICEKQKGRCQKCETVVDKKCIENVIFVHLNDKNISEMQKKINEKKRVFLSLNYVFLATKLIKKV